MIRWLADWYWTLVVMYRYKSNQPRQQWFKGVPDWHLDMFDGPIPSDEHETIKIIARQAKEEMWLRRIAT